MEHKTIHRKNVKHRAVKRIIIILSIFAIAISSIIVTIRTSYSKIVNIVDTDVIYPNIFVDNINVGGLTQLQAINKVYQAIGKDFEKKTITLVGEKNDRYIFSFKDLKASYDTLNSIKEAYNYARSGNIINRYETIIKLKSNPLKINSVYSFDKDFVKNKINEISTNVYVRPTNATIKRTNNSFVTTGETNGKKLDLEETIPYVYALLEKKTSGEVNLSFKELRPLYNEEDLKNVQNILGSYTTSFTTNDNNVARNENIINASNKINNSVVYPNEIFSVNKTLRPFTEANGYKNAPVIVANKIEEALGGGICQVSTTLYNAVLYSELNVVERQNHSLKVGYVDYAYDATLAGDYIDFKFKNSTNYPILIESLISENKLTVNIYGKETRSKTRKIKFENVLVDTITPKSENIIYTYDLPDGEKQTQIKAKNGYEYELFKVVTDGNKIIERTLVNKSRYKAVQGVTRIGGKQKKILSTPYNDVSAPETTKSNTTQENINQTNPITTNTTQEVTEKNIQEDITQETPAKLDEKQENNQEENINEDTNEEALQPLNT